MTTIEKNDEDQVPVSIEQSSVEIDDHAATCNDPTHHHNMPTFVDANDFLTTTKSAKPVKRKNKRNSRQDVTRAELIPGNRGNDNIEDLVKFINDPTVTNDKKSKKKSTTN